MTSLDALLERKERIAEMLLNGTTWKAIAYKMSEETGFKFSCGNICKQLNPYFRVTRDGRKVTDIQMRDYVTVTVRHSRGYKDVHVFLNMTKRKGFSAIPEVGQCKYPIGEYPFKLCDNHAVDGKPYCKKHIKICYVKREKNDTKR